MDVVGILTGSLTVLSTTIGATFGSTDISGLFLGSGTGVELGRRDCGGLGAFFGDELRITLLLLSFCSGEGVLYKYPRGCIIMTVVFVATAT